jgi:hypothetical protein
VSGFTQLFGDDYAVTGIFKRNAALGNVVGDLRLMSENLTKEDHVIIVGGPSSNLERDLNYQIEKDLDNSAKTSRHTNVGFVGLLRRHDRPHMNRWVISVNMRLKRALWTADKSHIPLIDESSLDMYDRNRHGLHLNHRGKGSLCNSLLTGLGVRFL